SSRRHEDVPRNSIKRCLSPRYSRWHRPHPGHSLGDVHCDCFVHRASRHSRVGCLVDHVRHRAKAIGRRAKGKGRQLTCVRYWHKAEITELNTAPLGFSAVIDRQFQEGPTVSFRILGSVMRVSLFALATGTHAQNAPQTTSNPSVKVTQGTTQPGPAEAPAKPSKGKAKKAKGGKGTGSGGPESRPPAPTGGSGPPDPGVYK